MSKKYGIRSSDNETVRLYLNSFGLPVMAESSKYESKATAQEVVFGEKTTASFYLAQLLLKDPSLIRCSPIVVRLE